MREKIMYRTVILILLIIFWSGPLLFAQQPPPPPPDNTFTMTTYYPAPFGAYDTIQLVPKSATFTPSSSCNVGTMYVDSNGKLQYCGGTGGTGTWGSMPSAWTQFGDNIYLTDTVNNPNLKVGIGTTSPQAKLEITGTPNASTLILNSVSVGTTSAPSEITFTNNVALDNGFPKFEMYDSYDGTFRIHRAVPLYYWDFCITKDGNVGVGTPAPNIQGGNSHARVLTISGEGAGIPQYADGRLELSNPNNSVVAGDVAGRVTWVMPNNASAAISKSLSQIATTTEGNGGANGYGGNLLFYTKADNYPQGLGIRMIIDNAGNIFMGPSGDGGNPPMTMTVQGANGNVGIGTTAPKAKLDVVGDYDSLRLTAASGNAPYTGLTFYPQDPTRYYLGGIRAHDKLSTYTPNGYAGRNVLELWAQDGDVEVTSGAGASRSNNFIVHGNVGIGTSDPVSGKLHIVSSEGNDYEGGVAVERSGVASTGRFFVDNNNILNITRGGGSTTAGRVIALDGNGKVGIGTTSPQAKLDISGTPGVDGIRFPDGTVQTTAGMPKCYWNGQAYTAGAVCYSVSGNCLVNSCNANGSWSSFGANCGGGPTCP